MPLLWNRGGIVVLPGVERPGRGREVKGPPCGEPDRRWLSPGSTTPATGPAHRHLRINLSYYGGVLPTGNRQRISPVKPEEGDYPIQLRPTSMGVATDAPLETPFRAAPQRFPFPSRWFDLPTGPDPHLSRVSVLPSAYWYCTRGLAHTRYRSCYGASDTRGGGH